MTILITGANGQLGNEMRLLASRQFTDRYIFTDVNQVEGQQTSYLDITDLDAIRKMVADNAVDAIVNCAAWTNVDAAENNEALVEKLNATAPQNLAIAMKEVNGLLIQISTDYVFGKEPYNVPCREDQKGTPTGIYGLTKLHGERKIAETACKSVILRTAWLYSEFGKNFCKTMLSLSATKPSLKVVFDQTGTPTYALDLANAIATVLKDYEEEMSSTTDSRTYSKAGIYHFSNEGVCSWFDFTQMIYSEGKKAGLIPADAACDIQPCHSSEFPSPVTRPSYSVLDKTKFKDSFAVRIPYWVDSLKECLANMAKQA